MLAVANAAFTSPQEFHETVLLLTCVYHARSGPSASSWPVDSQNCFRRALEITRIRCSDDRHLKSIVVRKIRTVNAEEGVVRRAGEVMPVMPPLLSPEA